jgi:thiamine biosynthesis protein ThiS
MSAITLWLNDQPVPATAQTLADFIQHYPLEGSFVLACNGRFISREQYPKLMLQHGDRLELLRPVAGG